MAGMGRSNRLSSGHVDGVLHVTHRCHNQAYLLKFRKDRDAYRAQLWEHARKFNVSVLDYCITSNHVHLLLDAPERSAVSSFMREVASEFARAYNKRKGRMNAVWGDNFHATFVQDGEHLWECLCYIELNMVRCGVVTHPRQWAWVGYQEILGIRQRYRVIDLERLCWRVRASSVAEVRRNLEVSLVERMARDGMRRQACWTESLAVGSREFVERVQPEIRTRQELRIETADERTWVLHDEVVSYSSKKA